MGNSKNIARHLLCAVLKHSLLLGLEFHLLVVQFCYYLSIIIGSHIHIHKNEKLCRHWDFISQKDFYNGCYYWALA